jgi:hypothetical protein
MNDMDITNVTNIINETILKEAEERGYKRGAYDALCLAEKYDSPLWGEWAGESIPELLGDLIALAENDEHANEICEAYEEGYSCGYNDTLAEEMVRMGNQD